MIHYIIPARAGSKRFPKKNRELIKYAETCIEGLNPVIISTDDPEIIEKYRSTCCIHYRDEKNATDEASTRDLLIEIVEDYALPKDDIIVMLYLTYPERTLKDIEKALQFFNKHSKMDSLLCKKEVPVHPCLYMYDYEPYGSQIIKNDFCRSQEYPPVFELSHYICIVRVGKLKYLNRNLYDIDTIFFPIGNFVDVDLEEDLEKINKGLSHVQSANLSS